MPLSAAAGVPVRVEKLNWCTYANPARSTARRVSRKSSSSSPGNPTITSVPMAISGQRSRSLSTIRKYSSNRYGRFIRSRTRSEPDCSGRCMWGHTLPEPKSAISPSVTWSGSIDVIRSLNPPSRPAMRPARPARSTSRDIYFPIVMPVRISSGIPAAISLAACSTTSLTSLLTGAPRTDGTMQ